MKIKKLTTFKGFFCLHLSLLILTACTDKEEPIGRWDDNIKLSTNKIEFGAQADSTIVTTEGSWWWINDIAVNDTNYFYMDLAEKDSYSIREDCFVIERRDKTTIFIKLDENKTGEKRVVSISLEAGNYFDSIGITQAAK